MLATTQGSLPFSLFMPQGREKSERLTVLKALAHPLGQLDAVEKVTVFHASVMLPSSACPLSSNAKTRFASRGMKAHVGLCVQPPNWVRGEGDRHGASGRYV
jgi:hypothetical protein